MMRMIRMDGTIPIPLSELLILYPYFPFGVGSLSPLIGCTL